MDVMKIVREGVHWNYLGHDRGKCWAVLGAVMVLWVPKIVGNFITG
jgi:hypothetical protein